MARPFVLVHGAWHGGWCWQRVTPLLRVAGREVHTPTLTGLGDRAHLANAAIDLEAHIADIVGFLEMENLRDVVLVGHSYGGAVITGVADRAPARLARLIHVDGFPLEHGECMVDCWTAEMREGLHARLSDGFIAPTPLPAFGVTRPEDLAWAEPRIRPQPFKTFTQPLMLAHGETKLPRAYIRCTAPARPALDRFTRRFRADPAWTYREIACGHDCMIADPEGTADLLLLLA
jgi:pimeloyl-ACP methyl ester carboxylesterase